MTIESPRRSFEVLRWMSVAAVVFIVVTFKGGFVSADMTVRGILFGLVWLGLNLLAWRIRSEKLLMLQFLVFMFVPRILGITDRNIATTQFIQWLCLVIAVAGLPLLIARGMFMHFAGLNDFPSPFSEADHKTEAERKRSDSEP